MISSDATNKINNLYFDWMYDIVTKGILAKDISYRKLLMRLHSTEFIFSIPKDGGRAKDGVDLRYRFASDHPHIKNAEEYIKGPCSVFEMILALAISIEEDIMDNPKLGDRTKQWFWGMIRSLGLSSMEDHMYDKSYIDVIIDRFLHRQYDANGHGGLFTIRECEYDLRRVEIWYQACWYLNTISY